MVKIQQTSFKQNFKGLQSLLDASPKKRGLKSERKTAQPSRVFLKQVASHLPQAKRKGGLSITKQVAHAYIRYIKTHKNQVRDLLSAKKAHRLFIKIVSPLKDLHEKAELEKEFYKALNDKLQKDLYEYTQCAKPLSKPSVVKKRILSLSKTTLKAKKISSASKVSHKANVKEKKKVFSKKKRTSAQSTLLSFGPKVKSRLSVSTRKARLSSLKTPQVAASSKKAAKKPLAKASIKANKAHLSSQKKFKISLLPKLKTESKGHKLKCRRVRKPQLALSV